MYDACVPWPERPKGAKLEYQLKMAFFFHFSHNIYRFFIVLD